MCRRPIALVAALAVMGVVIQAAGVAAAAEAAAAPATQPAASSRIVAVTVYQPDALVTREVDVPARQGPTELVVGPLPASTVATSLYSEGSDGLRVLSTRFRTRVYAQATEAEARRTEEAIREAGREAQVLEQAITTAQANAQFLTKLEGFTGATMATVTEKGQLNAEAVTALAKFVMTQRASVANDLVLTQQKLAQVRERIEFLNRERSKLAAGVDRTVREAIVVVDNERGAAGKVRFNYLVTAAGWRPSYKLRANPDPAKAEVNVEYLAAMQQQTGEDWTGVELTLSTAQPMLNAAPPELAMLEVGTTAKGEQVAGGGVVINGARLAGRSADNRRQAALARNEAQQLFNSTRNFEDANKRYNDAAAFQQGDEILNAEQLVVMGQAKPGGRAGGPAASSAFLEGQSVTYKLERRLSVPWRDDEQLIEVARLTLKPDWFYKAVPVLTPHVYRLADLTNDSRYVLLPGEATVYIGTDFVGRTTLPLVAIGEQFTAGFGVDPQLQVSRQLVDKGRTVQGGNQVLRFDYRLSVSSYKAEPVKLQLWDRLPHSETDAVTVTLVSTSRETSAEPAYVREEKPRNLLRWDLTVEPGTKGEKAAVVNYSFKLEFAKDAQIANFLSR